MKSWLSFLLILLLIGCQQNHPLQKEYPKTIYIQLSNNADVDRTDELISLNINDLSAKYADFNSGAFVVIDGSNELASQTVDKDGDGNNDGIAFICNLKSHETKDVTILYSADGSKSRNYPKRTQAEMAHKFGGKFVNREYIGGEFKNVDFMKVPPEHTDHSWYIRYEGPGWESDKVGYRFYLDWRNAVDVFGKKTPEMVLQNVGLDGFDSYHKMSDWGMDILKVGSSLGIGTIAMWIADSAQRVEKTDSVSSAIIDNGVIHSAIKTNYFGWHIGDHSYNLISYLSINAGSRLTECDLKLDSTPPNLCTGIVKDDSAEVMLSKEDAGEWQFLATYGKQSLNNDNLGMAVLYRKSELDKMAEDTHSHVIVLKPADGTLTYYFLAAWQLEPAGITNKAAFSKYLNDTVIKLNNPVSVSIN